ncbi:hypothetical protein HN709_01170 [Candidatus Peregrinibacteria bacterium]|nr:hypothetical protein [Candidatus Peregrinibacteria bacterium]
MKKFLPVIIGTMIGAVLAAGLIVNDHNTAYSEESETSWVDAVAAGNAFEWKDIFPPYSNRGIYELVYKKLLVNPEKDALADVAQGYGLTKDEAWAVVNGSITPIFNNPDRKSFKLSKEQAIDMASALREEFQFYQELYDIQMEIDVAIKPSEIFSNGDLNDSGFDLVHDLHVIEEVLFKDRTETTVGQPFDNALDSPYLPTDRDETNEAYIAEDIISDSGGNSEGGTEQMKAALSVGDTDIPVSILSSDVCEPDNKYLDALNDFDDENQGSGGNNGDGDNNGSGDGDNNGDDNDPDDGTGAGNYDGPLSPEEIEKELAVPKDKWLKSWCPSLEGDPDSPGAYGNAGFASLRGSGGSIKDLLDSSSGAAAGYSSEQISAQIAICLNIELVWKKVSSYQPGDSCVMCEIEKINTYMAKTLDHTLSPNKATGNLMESGKCKDGYGEFIDMQFITIAKPIPTPANDDVVFGRNIAEEWTKFVENYQPLGYNQLTSGGDADDTADNQLDRALSTTAPGTSVSDIIDKVASDMAKKESEARSKLDEEIESSGAQNVIIHAQTVLLNLKQMNSYFKGYNVLYDEIAKEVCPEILNKKST